LIGSAGAHTDSQTDHATLYVAIGRNCCDATY